MANETEKLTLLIFDENNLEELQLKSMLGVGAKMGLQGDKKHTFLMFYQIDNRVFPNNHPKWHGLEWWGIVHML